MVGKREASSRNIFRCQSLADLSRQLRYAPESRQLEQIARTEALHDQIDPEANYPFSFIIYRITHYRQINESDEILPGDAVQPDLRSIINDLTRHHPCTPDTLHEPYDTIASLAKKMQVSSRTLHRWRSAGLRWRWAKLPTHKQPILVISASAWEAFVKHQPHVTGQANTKSFLSEEDKQQIVQRAKALVTEQAITSLNQAASVIASEMSWSLETIRQHLKRHDEAHPKAAIFPEHRGPLSDKDRRMILRAWRRGIPISKLMQRFRKSRPSMYHAIHMARANEIKQLTLEAHVLPIFQREDVEEVLFRPTQIKPNKSKPVNQAENIQRMSNTIRDEYIQDHAAFAQALPDPLASLCPPCRLSEAQVRTWLIRYNYLKYSARRQRDAFDPHHPQAAMLDAFDQTLARARLTRDELVQNMLEAVLSLCRRQLIDTPNRNSIHHLFSLLKPAHVELFDAIEQYHPNSAASFYAYFSNRLLKRFVQSQDKLISPQAIRRRSPQAMCDELIEQAKRYNIQLKPNEHVNEKKP